MTKRMICLTKVDGGELLIDPETITSAERMEAQPETGDEDHDKYRRKVSMTVVKSRTSTGLSMMPYETHVSSQVVETPSQIEEMAGLRIWDVVRYAQ